MAIDLSGVPAPQGRNSHGSGRERRECERAITYWQEKRRELGEDVGVGALELGRINDPEWSNRFLIANDPLIERSLLLMYGSRFAQLLELPRQVRTDLPILRQLPPRYGNLFLQGCAEARRGMAAVRLEGEVVRDDGRIEQYRAGFVPVSVKPQALTWLSFGAFNNRIVEEGTA